MKIDIDHIHHWMQAIRQSNNPMRTMDAFWSGQLKSKEWLIDRLEFVIRPNINKEVMSIDIHGGWVGVLSSMLFQSNLHISKIRSIDIDIYCQHVAYAMNKIEEIQQRFIAITDDMLNVDSNADIIINTSCEHITQKQYDIWLSRLPSKSMLVLQSNDYKIDEHIRTCEDLDDFKKQSNISVIFGEKLVLPMYNRYMLIGYKHV
jgi:hypothetical protein